MLTWDIECQAGPSPQKTLAGKGAGQQEDISALHKLNRSPWLFVQKREGGPPRPSGFILSQDAKPRACVSWEVKFRKSGYKVFGLHFALLSPIK